MVRKGSMACDQWLPGHLGLYLSTIGQHCLLRSILPTTYSGPLRRIASAEQHFLSLYNGRHLRRFCIAKRKACLLHTGNLGMKGLHKPVALYSIHFLMARRLWPVLVLLSCSLRTSKMAEICY
ncbi:hypothetical protein VTL71DRAFT_1586 [Oculimacula yallundae]|uniref:Uncharacterized protein n=1 Tax=Oculimacula yallundae TaxID=86028 RepID=A0ABR4CB40_9HELO